MKLKIIPKVAKTEAKEFWQFIRPTSKHKWRSIAFMLWAVAILIDIVVLALPRHHPFVNGLRIAANVCNLPLLLYSVVGIVKIAFGMRKSNRELAELMHQSEIKLVVLDTLLELEYRKLSPDERMKVMLRSPGGPKE